MGLIGMKDRALSVGGQLKISSTAKEGTEVVVVIPRTLPEREQINDLVSEGGFTSSSTNFND